MNVVYKSIPLRDNLYMSMQLRPQHQSVLLGLAQGWDTNQIAQALGRSRSAVYLWINESRAIIESRVPPDREDLLLQAKSVTGLVLVARALGYIDPDIRLLESGRFALSPSAAARGRQL